MNKALIYSLLGTFTSVASYLVVQFPQYAVWFTIGGMVASGLLKSPVFAEKPQ